MADRKRQAARGHDALLERFAAEVDPDGVLSLEEREARARNLYSAHMKRLSLASAKARRQRAVA